MKTQVLAHLRRLCGRRATLVVVVLSLGAALTMNVYFWANSRQLPPAVAAIAEQEWLEREQLRPSHLELCIAGYSVASVTVEPNTRDRCEREWIDNQSYADPSRFYFAQVRSRLVDMGLVFLLSAMVFGGVVGGGEWTSRVISAATLWEPRRLRLYAGQLIALLLLVAVGIAALSLIFLGLAAGVTLLRGTFLSVDESWLVACLLLVGRLLIVGLVGAAIGFGVSFLVRGTAGAVGLCLGFIILQAMFPEVFPVNFMFSAQDFVKTAFPFGYRPGTVGGLMEILGIGMLVVAGGGLRFARGDLT